MSTKNTPSTLCVATFVTFQHQSEGCTGRVRLGSTTVPDAAAPPPPIAPPRTQASLHREMKTYLPHLHSSLRAPTAMGKSLRSMNIPKSCLNPPAFPCTTTNNKQFDEGRTCLVKRLELYTKGRVARTKKELPLQGPRHCDNTRAGPKLVVVFTPMPRQGVSQRGERGGAARESEPKQEASPSRVCAKGEQREYLKMPQQMMSRLEEEMAPLERDGTARRYGTAYVRHERLRCGHVRQRSNAAPLGRITRCPRRVVRERSRSQSRCVRLRRSNQ